MRWIVPSRAYRLRNAPDFRVPMLISSPALINSSLAPLAVICFAVSLLGQDGREVVDFQREIQPIFERLSDDEKATFLNWLDQGAKVPEGVKLMGEPEEKLHGQALFEFEIAPLLAKHCLECHDTSRKEGALDLSRKAAAFKGGDSGEAIHPGDGENSSLWELVELGDMPEDRSPLSQREKDLLKRWIDEGAVWTVDWIDPAIYERTGGGEQWIRRLTVNEYIETVRSVVGVDIEDEARELLPADLRADGFSNTAYNLNVDMGHVTAYAELASKIVSKLDLTGLAYRFHEKPKFTDKDMGKLIEGIGKWFLRGPLTEDEVILFRGISTTVASAGGTMEEAVGYIAEAMLQSPRFIYRIEKQQGDGVSSQLDEYEFASRLSYAFWGAPPDGKLMAAADSGDLKDDGGLESQLYRMLDDPRAKARSLEFAYEWLNLGRMDSLQPSSEKFPDWDPRLADDMGRETLAVFDEVVWKQGRPLTELLNTQTTFATPELAAHYGLRVKQGTEAEAGLLRFDLSNNPARGGILTHGSVLTMGGDDASMVTRGLFVLRDLLRGTVKDPPPCLDTTPIPSSPGQSQRVISEERIANNSCRGCHEKFEPLAFGLERFDGVGAYYKRDVFGNRLREDGEVPLPGEEGARPYKKSSQMMDLLADSNRVAETITWKLVQFVMGRPLGARDAIEIKKIFQEGQENGGTYQSLMMAIATSDLMRMRGGDS
jgi:hypothetical protein